MTRSASIRTCSKISQACSRPLSWPSCGFRDRECECGVERQALVDHGVAGVVDERDVLADGFGPLLGGVGAQIDGALWRVERSDLLDFLARLRQRLQAEPSPRDQAELRISVFLESLRAGVRLVAAAFAAAANRGLRLGSPRVAGIPEGRDDDRRILALRASRLLQLRVDGRGNCRVQGLPLDEVTGLAVG